MKNKLEKKVLLSWVLFSLSMEKLRTLRDFHLYCTCIISHICKFTCKFSKTINCSWKKRIKREMWESPLGHFNEMELSKVDCFWTSMHMCLHIVMSVHLLILNWLNLTVLIIICFNIFPFSLIVSLSTLNCLVLKC